MREKGRCVRRNPLLTRIPMKACEKGPGYSRQAGWYSSLIRPIASVNCSSLREWFNNREPRCLDDAMPIDKFYLTKTIEKSEIVDYSTLHTDLLYIRFLPSFSRNVHGMVKIRCNSNAITLEYICKMATFNSVFLQVLTAPQRRTSPCYAILSRSKHLHEKFEMI